VGYRASLLLYNVGSLPPAVQRG